MTTLRLESHLFAVLRRAFDGAADGIDDWELPPVPLDVVAVLRTKLAEAAASALPGLSIVLTLSPADIEVLSACFSVGGEGDPAVTDDQYEGILAALGQAARSVV